MSEPTANEIFETKIYKQWGLTESEYLQIIALIDKKPNYTETGLFSVMWSEHCSYKNSKAVLRNFPNSGKHILQGPGEGAGIVDIGDGKAVVFKAESHNHPSAIEPYEGAATGVGGIIRDIFSMGAEPLALLDSLRFGEIKDNHTKYIINEVVAGIGGYGNCIGIPTVGGDIYFDKTYQKNPLVNAMCVGVIDVQDIKKGRAIGSGNAIVYVGAKTGRDGIHGATFASDEFSDEKETQRSAVQVGDPFMEKLLMDACLDVIKNHNDWIVGIQDMGAAGLVSSTAEMASKSNSGLILDLSRVPQREEQMTPYEIMLSESQERMVLCVDKDYVKQVIQLFDGYGLDAVEIGEVTEKKRYILKHNQQVVADLPIAALVDDVPEYRRIEKCPERFNQIQQKAFLPVINSVEETLIDMMKEPNIASKKSFYETYDSQVKTNTIVRPGSDASVINVPKTNKALAMTTDGNSRYIYLDPEVGGQIAVAEAARNIVCSGGKSLAITDCLNYGNPENPEVFWEFKKSVIGISAACKMFQTPVISGNVSLYNEYNGQAIYPSPMIGMVGLINDLDLITSSFFKHENDLIYIIGQTGDDYSGSIIQSIQTQAIYGDIQFDLKKEQYNQSLITQLIENKLIASAHDVSEGGIICAMFESAFQNDLSFNIAVNLSKTQLFSETQSRFIVSINPKNKQDFEKLALNDAHYVGVVTQSKYSNIKTLTSDDSIETKKIKKIWEEQIPCLMK